MPKPEPAPVAVTALENAASMRIIENSDVRVALVKTSELTTAGSEAVRQVVISLSVAGKMLNFNRKSTDLIGQVLSRMKISCGKALKEAGTPSALADTSPVKKMHKGEKGVLVQPEVSFINSESVKIEEGTLEEVLTQSSRLMIDGEDYHLVQDPPVVTSLELDNQVWAGFPCVATWTCTGASEDDFEFEWRIVSPESGESVEIVKGKRHIFTPESRHVGMFLEVRCFHPKFLEYHMSAISTDRISHFSTSPLEKREARLDAPLLRTDKQTVRVASFNILAQPYLRTPLAQDSYYTHLHKQWHLTDWSRRSPLIMREMLDANADIYCLQEVAGGAHETQIKRLLSGEYNWHFFGKESRANNGNPIGVSISLRREVFEVISEYKLNLGMDGLFESMLTNQEKKDIESKFGDSFFQGPVLKGIHTVAGVVHARNRLNDKHVLVANTHLFFHPMGGHIRILQGLCLMRKLAQLRSEISACPSVIVCGDFNSRPDSGSFQVISAGLIHANNQDWQYGKSFRASASNAEQEDDEAAATATDLNVSETETPPIPVEGIDLAHSLDVAHVPCRVPELTHATASFRSTLDYVFFTKENFEAVEGPGTGSSIPQLTNGEVDRMGGLPFDHYGSDHVLVCGDLRFK